MAENARKTSFKKSVKAADSTDVTSLKKSLIAAARKERKLLAAIKEEASGATSDAIINGF
jgi:hypothetical protein